MPDGHAQGSRGAFYLYRLGAIGTYSREGLDPKCCREFSSSQLRMRTSSWLVLGLLHKREPQVLRAFFGRLQAHPVSQCDLLPCWTTRIAEAMSPETSEILLGTISVVLASLATLL